MVKVVISLNYFNFNFMKNFFLNIYSINLYFFIIFFTISCKNNTSSHKDFINKTDSTHVISSQPDIDYDSLKKKIYLTFDDGPNPGTPIVHKILNDEKVVANFFLIGLHVNGSPGQKLWFEALKADKTLELYNHSFTHAWRNKFDRFYNHPDSVLSDFNKALASMEIKNHVLRTPGRNAWRIDSTRHVDNKNSVKAVDFLHDNGYAALGWDVEWMFKRNRITMTADSLYRQIKYLLQKNETKNTNHIVLLAHDQAFKNPEDALQLKRFIELVKANPDWKLEHVSKYPGIKKYLN